MNPEFSTKPAADASAFSPIDIDQIPEAPPRGLRHRRAHSETFFRFPDDLLFDVSDVDLSAIDLPATTDAAANNAKAAGANNNLDAPMALDSGGDNKSGSATSRPPPPAGHLRSLSMDADFFEGLSFGTPSFDGGDNGGKSAVAVPSAAGGKGVGLHRWNSSMDGSSSSFEADSLMDGMKKSMTPEKLAELALIDPKRAKRILANRQSAARSKERKIRYTIELERKVQTLQTEATTLSAQVTMLQRDTTELTAENRELKLRLQAMEQQAQLRDALNETLREEVQRLRIASGQIPATNGNASNRSQTPFGGQQTQQPQFSVPQPASNDENASKQLQPSFLDFSHRV